MEELEMQMLSGLVFIMECFLGALCTVFILYLICQICDSPKDRKLLKEYKAHHSEFEQWLKYRDKTMRGDY